MAKYNRLYQEIPLSKGLEAQLTLPAAHYLTNVMRLRIGDSFLVFNGHDGEWLATLAGIQKKETFFKVTQLIRPQLAPPNSHCQLLFSPIKPHRLSFLLEKATELGVSVLQPILTQHSTVRSFNHSKAMAQVIEAAEQSERLTVPLLNELENLSNILDHWPDDHPLLICDERRDSKPLVQTLEAIEALEVSFMVGPEGGFSTTEFSQFEKYPFIKFISLGSTILRTETAALVALALFHCR